MAAGQPRRLIAARVLAAGVLAVGVLAQGAAPASAIVDLWSISGSPTSLDQSEAVAVKFTVKNKGAILDADIGCVEVTIPEAFDVISTAVVDTPSGKSWNAGDSGSGSGRTARYRADSDSDALEGGLLGGDESATFSVRVDPGSAGGFAWTARAYADNSCDGGLFAPSLLSISVAPKPSPTPSPKPTATPTPTPRPTPTPTPRPTATPTPRATPSPIIGLPPLPLPTIGLPKPTPTPDSSPSPPRPKLERRLRLRRVATRHRRRQQPAQRIPMPVVPAVDPRAACAWDVRLMAWKLRVRRSTSRWPAWTGSDR